MIHKYMCLFLPCGDECWGQRWRRSCGKMRDITKPRVLPGCWEEKPVKGQRRFSQGEFGKNMGVTVVFRIQDAGSKGKFLIRNR